MAFAAPPQLRAAEGELGNPQMAFYRQEQHGGSAQTFSIEADDRGRLYFANLAGVLVFDGAWWTKVELPGTAASYLASDGHDTIIAAGESDFGVIAPDATGALRFRSLLPTLPSHLRSNLESPSFCSGDGLIGMFTDTFVGVIERGRFRLLEEIPAGAPTPRRCSVARGHVWIATADATREIGGTGALPGLRADAVTSSFAIVRGKGIFDLAGRQLENPASVWLDGKTVMQLVPMSGGRWAIATLRDGLVIVTQQFEIERIIDAAAGLPDELLYSVREDREGALWLAFDNAIARIEASPRITVLDRRIGLRGGLRSVARVDGILYAATGQGLFRVDATGSGARATQIAPEIRFPWSMVSIDGEMLVGAFGGVYSIGAGGVASLLPGTGDLLPYAMKRSQRDRDLVWLGLSDGVGRLRREASGRWTYEGIVENTPGNVRSLVERDGVLWATSDIDGIARVDPDGRATRLASKSSDLLEVGDRVVFLSGSRFLEPGPAGRLVPDRQFGGLEIKDDFFADADAAGNLWLTTRPPRVLLRKADGSYESEFRTIGIEGETDGIFADADGVVWIPTERGIYRIEPPIVPETPQPKPMLHRAIAGDRTIAGSATATRQIELPRRYGRLRIEVSPLAFRPGTAFQYRLDPIDDSWGDPAPQAYVEYTTLPPGDYTFRARSVSAGGRTSDEVRWSFRVPRPWYLTRWASLVFVLLGIALVYAYLRLRTRTLRRRARHLQERVDAQTLMLLEANRQLAQANERLEKLSLVDELTHVANRRYFDRALADEFDRAVRREEPMSLVFLDIDHFKEINDSLGHSAGDDVLRRLGELLARAAGGKGDVVARYGGEEFAILLRDTTIETAMEFAEEIRTEVETLGITASLGVATATGEATPHELIERADRALYAAKRAGRNRVATAD
jgi:diguanylate cyclase (GGDEF)-like protein